MLLQNRLNSINSQVKVYLDEIAKLQAKVTQLQAHAQEVKGAEQAAESALAQIDTAISMLAAICPTEIDVFKAAIDAKFNAPLPQLQGDADDDDEDVIVKDATTPPAPDDANETIETTFSVVVDDSDDESNSEVVKAVDDNADNVQSIEFESNSVDASDFDSSQDEDSDNDGNGTVADSSGTSGGNGNGDGNGHNRMTYRDLQIVDRPTLIKLANLHNIPGYKSKKRDELASLLDGLVSSDELTVVKNGKH